MKSWGPGPFLRGGTLPEFPELTWLSNWGPWSKGQMKCGILGRTQDTTE